MSSKPSLPKGTRDFSPSQLAKRNYIFGIIKNVFEKYGYQPIETPSMERLDTLTGKYGEEGDQLLFKVLNSGDFMSKAKELDNYKKLAFQICEKGLRYDLTIPFARYVVMHQNEITFPFKRYQIQPVWRGDRPQKGRFQEFYQCDVDVIGSNSLVHEAEFIQIYDEVFARLNLKVSIKISNRKILQGLAEVVGAPDKMIAITVAIDKLDKVEWKGVEAELLSKEISPEAVEKIKQFIDNAQNFSFEKLENFMQNSEAGKKGIAEIRQTLDFIKEIPLHNEVEVDTTLARGLNYYTGFICEVKAKDAQMGSIGGGGRYDDLTGMFGLKNMSGVGISFGAERIFEVMEELQLFPENTLKGTSVLVVTFDEASLLYAMPVVRSLRNATISTELYPEATKLKKQMEYANKKNIPYVILIGEEEMKSGFLTFKNMLTGEQEKITLPEIINRFHIG